MRSLSIALVVSVSAALSACASLPRTLEPEPLFPKPSETIDAAGLPKGQSGNLCDKTARLDGTRIPSELTRFAVAMHCAYQLEPSDSDFQFWMVRFVDKGIALSNQTCEAFFDQLEARRVEAAYSQTNVNIGGTAVTAILAATNSNTRSIFNLATALTLANAWFENYKSNYILTPQLNKLYSKIQDSLRAPIAEQIVAKSKANGYRSFDEAKQDVMKYDKLCSHKVLQDIVADSVAKADLRPFTAPTSPEKSAQVASSKQELYRIASGGAAGDFAAGEFEALYVVASTTPDVERIAMAKALTDPATGLEPKLASYVSKLGLDASTPTAGVLANFQYVGEVSHLESSADVLAIRAKLKEKIANAPTVAKGAPGAPVAVDPAKAQAEQNAFRALMRRAAAVPTVGPISFAYEVRDHRP